jgi:hypothetical protein
VAVGPARRRDFREPARVELGAARSAVYRRGEVALSSIEKKRAQRLRFMNALYEVVDGREGQFADMNAFLTELGYDFDKEEHSNEFQSIAGYLKGEGLITTIHTKDRGLSRLDLSTKAFARLKQLGAGQTNRPSTFLQQTISACST